MTTIPLHCPADTQGLNEGDIVTIAGIWNRPKATTLRYWAMLIFSPARAARRMGWLWPHRAESDPLEFMPLTRGELPRKRELQRFRVTQGS